MKKFENITVLYVDDFDYTNQELLPEVIKVIDTADIVIDGDKVVKNRVNEMGFQQGSGALKTFNGLSLNPVDALFNIAAMNEVGLLFVASNNNEYSELGDAIIAFARDYATAAHAYALEKGK